MSEDLPDFITAPDLSFTITTKALLRLNHGLVHHPLPEGTCDLHWCAHIFSSLMLLEGYDDQTAHRLAHDPLYRVAVESIYYIYKEWKSGNV
jgi:hypothetical protein